MQKTICDKILDNISIYGSHEQIKYIPQNEPFYGKINSLSGTVDGIFVKRKRHVYHLWGGNAPVGSSYSGQYTQFSTYIPVKVHAFR